MSKAQANNYIIPMEYEVENYKYVDLDTFHWKLLYYVARAHPRGDGGCRSAAPPNPQNRNLKNTDFVDIII
jgi:hypothetical protein